MENKPESFVREHLTMAMRRRLKELRKEHGYDQAKCGSVLGIGVSAYNKKERQGERYASGLKGHEMLLIATRLYPGLSMNWLLLGEGPKWLDRIEERRRAAGEN